MTHGLREASAELLALVMMSLVALFLALPSLLALIAGTAGSASGLLGIVRVWQDYKAAQYQLISTDFPMIENSAKVAFAGVAYLALIFALNVLIAGMLGRRRQHFYLIPGLLLSFPALVAFTISAALIIRLLAGITGWSELPFALFYGYAGFAAVLLAMLLTDLRTTKRPSRLSALRRWLLGLFIRRKRVSQDSLPLPALRFGTPSKPLQLKTNANSANATAQVDELETIETPAVASSARPATLAIDERETVETPAALPVAVPIEAQETTELPVPAPVKAPGNQKHRPH